MLKRVLANDRDFSVDLTINLNWHTGIMYLIKSLSQSNWHRVILNNACLISLLKEENTNT
jgi:hypothetical protein